MEGPSTGTIFAVSFLGALFAIVVALLCVYTYVTLRLIPRIKQGFREFVEDIGPKALFERANVDPAELMEELDISPAEALAALKKRGLDDPTVGNVRIIFTCEDHGRCDGCPKVLAQFDAIIKHQGEDSFDEVERKCYAQLKDQLANDVARAGESEAA